jgi:hypothetical protein
MSALTIPPVVQSGAVSQEFGILQALASHYLAGKTLSAPVLMSLAAALSAEVNNIKTLKSADKKTLVCDIVNQALLTALAASKIGIGSPAVSAEEEVALTYVSKNVIPASVDLLVAAANGSLNLKGLPKKLFGNCFSCVPVLENNLRGPVWDVVDAFVKAVDNSNDHSASLKDAVKAGVAVATAEVKKVSEVAAAVAAVAVSEVAAAVAVAEVAVAVSDEKAPVASEVPSQ